LFPPRSQPFRRHRRCLTWLAEWNTRRLKQNRIPFCGPNSILSIGPSSAGPPPSWPIAKAWGGGRARLRSSSPHTKKSLGFSSYSSPPPGAPGGPPDGGGGRRDAAGPSAAPRLRHLTPPPTAITTITITTDALSPPLPSPQGPFLRPRAPPSDPLTLTIAFTTLITVTITCPSIKVFLQNEGPFSPVEPALVLTNAPACHTPPNLLPPPPRGGGVGSPRKAPITTSAFTTAAGAIPPRAHRMHWTLRP